jgi:hypothetical protein
MSSFEINWDLIGLDYTFSRVIDVNLFLIRENVIVHLDTTINIGG